MTLRLALILVLIGSTTAVRPDKVPQEALKDTAIEFRGDGHMVKPKAAAEAALEIRGHDQKKDQPATAATAVDHTVAKKDGATGDTAAKKKEQDGMVNSFMTQQGQSKQACHSRLLQAKIFLDKLLRDKSELGRLLLEQLLRKKAQEDKLKQAQDLIQLINENHMTARAECDKQYEEGMGEVQRYDAELQELKDIANPSFTHHDLEADEDVEKHTKPKTPEQTSLVQSGVGTWSVEVKNWDLATCQAFVDAIHRNHADSFVGIKAGDRCDADRERLKVVFVETYINVTERRMATLHEVTRTREECYAAAKLVMEEALVGPIENERESQLGIKEATNKIDELTPLYLRVMDREKKMVVYINDELKPECEAELDASDTMRAIRHLIHDLAACPTYKELKLTIPEVIMDPVMVVDLKWHNKNDLDMKFDGPAGSISHAHTRVPLEGFLEKDDNWEGAPNFKQLTSEPREAIFITKAPDGKYTIFVRLFKAHETGATATNFECELKSNLFLQELCVYGSDCEANVQLSDEVGERKDFQGVIEGESAAYVKLMTFEIANGGKEPERDPRDEATSGASGGEDLIEESTS